MADSRFKAFTDEERTVISVGLALFAWDAATGALTGSEVFDELRLLETMEVIATLADEIGSEFGQGIDPDVLTRLRWKLHNEQEQRPQPGGEET